MTLIPENGFRQKRAQQLCAFLFRWNGATRFSYDKIAALLYLAERQCYGEHGIPLTYDQLQNTFEGPSLSKTLEMVFKRDLEMVFKRHNPAETMSEFSTEEIETIECAFEVYSTYTDAELLAHLKSLKEWQYVREAPGAPIPLEKILEAVGFAPEEVVPQIDLILNSQVHAKSPVPA
jgi:hypothetical protein